MSKIAASKLVIYYGLSYNKIIMKIMIDEVSIMLQAQQQGRAQIRSKNKVRIFYEIVKCGELSRTQLEKQLGLSASSVTRIIEEMIKENLVYETRTEDTSIGRKPILLRVRSDCFYTIGVHIKRTILYLCIIDMQGKIIYQSSIDISSITSSKQLESSFLKAILNAKEAVGITNKEILGIGIAARGVVDSIHGIIIRFKKDVENVELGKAITHNFNCYWYIENNILADIHSQYMQKTILSKRNLLYLYVDEGVGCSIISEGQIIKGNSFLAGKLAHLMVEKEGKLCSCGKRGHLESYVISSAIQEAFYEKTALTETLQGICERANRKEEVALQIMQEVMEKLAYAIVELITILNPGSIVLDGIIFENFTQSLEFLKESVREQVFIPSLANIEWAIRKKKDRSLEKDIAKDTIKKALKMRLSY